MSIELLHRAVSRRLCEPTFATEVSVFAYPTAGVLAMDWDAETKQFSLRVPAHTKPPAVTTFSVPSLAAEAFVAEFWRERFPSPKS